jgi:hypothetical protein
MLTGPPRATAIIFSRAGVPHLFAQRFVNFEKVL